MNKLTIIGNLTRDVETSQTASGITVARFAVAVNRRYQTSDGDHKTDFFNVSAWRGLAENASKFLKKGSKVCVSGPIQFDMYKDKNGNNQMSAQLTAEEIEFLSSNQQQTTVTAETPAPKGFVEDVEEGDIPF